MTGPDADHLKPLLLGKQWKLHGCWRQWGHLFQALCQMPVLSGFQTPTCYDLCDPKEPHCFSSDDQRHNNSKCSVHTQVLQTFVWLLSLASLLNIFLVSPGAFLLARRSLPALIVYSPSIIHLFIHFSKNMIELGLLQWMAMQSPCPHGAYFLKEWQPINKTSRVVRKYEKAMKKMSRLM